MPSGEISKFVFQTERYETKICPVIQDFGNRICDFQKITTVVEHLSFPFKSDLNIQETASYYL
jgi:hypothetical protein